MSNVQPMFCTWQLGQDWNASRWSECSDDAHTIETPDPPSHCPECGKRVKVGDLGLLT